MPATEPLTLSVPEAAKRIGVSYPTLRTMIAEGKVETVPMLKRVRVPVSEVERLTTPTDAE